MKKGEFYLLKPGQEVEKEGEPSPYKMPYWIGKLKVFMTPSLLFFIYILFLT